MGNEPNATSTSTKPQSANAFDQFIDDVNDRLSKDAECSIEARHGLRAYLWQINRILLSPDGSNVKTE